MKIKGKTKKADYQGLVPKLRFPEFQDTGEWKRESLGLYLEQYSEKVPSSTQLDVYSSTREGIKPQSEYYDGRQIINDGEYGVVPNGYFVYRHMSDDHIFKFNMNTLGKKIAVSKEYPVFKTVNLVSEFLIYKLNEGIEFKRFADSQKKGGTRTRLYFKTLCAFECSFPSFEEQKKIADCLSSLDELITAQAHKLDTIKAHKKGLMQQLFPAPGQTTPTLRFPDFRGPWKTKPISSLTPINKKYGIVDGPFGSNLKSIHYRSEGIPIIASGFVTDGVFNPKECLYVDENKFNQEKRSSVSSGDIVMAKIGARCGASAIMPKGHSTGILSGNALKITVDSLRYSTEFVWQRLWSLYDSGQLHSLRAEGAQPAISIANLKKYLIEIPERNEQEMIANCLSSLDELIAAQAHKLDILKAHKKGLMQQLFPNPDEANG